MDPEQRQQMISEAAYFKAEHRAFAGGDPLQDWLAAESEIDALLYSHRLDASETAAVHARLREEVRKALAQIQDVVDVAAVRGAFERAMGELKRLEGVSAESLQRAAATVRQEMAHAAERMGPSWEHFSERSAGLFSVWKDRGRAFLDRSARAVHDWLHHEHPGARH